MNYSQKQLAHIGGLAGLIVIVLSKFNVVISTEEVTFAIGALLTLGSTAWNYWNRYKKGDLTLGGFRKY